MRKQPSTKQSTEPASVPTTASTAKNLQLVIVRSIAISTFIVHLLISVLSGGLRMSNLDALLKCIKREGNSSMITSAMLSTNSSKFKSIGSSSFKNCVENNVSEELW